MQLKILLLLIYASCGFASEGTFGYETIFFYYVYRLEIECYGAGNTWIATDCNKGKGVPCDLDAFAKFIQRLNSKTNLENGAPGLHIEPFEGNLKRLGDYPTVQAAIQELQKTGYTKLKYDTSKLLPRASISRYPTHRELYEEFKHIIELSKQDLNKGKGLDDLIQYKRLKSSIGPVIDARRIEQNNHLIKAFEKEMEGRKIDIPTITKSKPTAVGIVKELDTYAMLDMLGRKTADKPEFRRFIREFSHRYREGEYGEVNGKREAIDHQRIIDRATACEHSIRAPICELV